MEEDLGGGDEENSSRRRALSFFCAEERVGRCGRESRVEAGTLHFLCGRAERASQEAGRKRDGRMSHQKVVHLLVFLVVGDIV